MSTLVASYKTFCPYLTCNAINNYLRRRMQILGNVMLSTSATPETTGVMDITVADTEVTERINGVRPDGITDKKKKH